MDPIDVISLDGEDENEKTPVVLLRIIIPFVITGLFILATCFFLTPAQVMILFGMMVAYVLPPAGKETVIPMGMVFGLPWWLMAFTIGFLDFVGGLFMAWNFPLALKIPYLGPWMARFMASGETYLNRRPWLERLYFLGLVLFVSFPLEGSGSIAGTIVGRMLGMGKKEVLAAITIGGFLGGFAIALGADYIRELLLRDVFVGLSIVALILVVIAIAVMYRSYQRRRRRQPAG